MSLSVSEARSRLAAVVSELREIAGWEGMNQNLPDELEHRTRLRYDLHYCANTIERAYFVLGVKRAEEGT